MNVSEFTTYATLSATTTINQPQQRTVTFTTVYSFYLDQGDGYYGVGSYSPGYPYDYESDGAWTNAGAADSSCVTYNPTAQPEPTGFYQVFTNHCDSADYLSHSLGSTAINDGDTTHDISGTLVTHTTANGSLATLGYAQGDRAGEFDKVCSYAGVRDSTGSTPNDGSGTPTTTPALASGAAATGSSASLPSLTYFRDNMAHGFAVDHYAPVTTGLVHYTKGTSALATVVSLWKGSTPKAPGVSNLGQFQMTAGGNNLFSNSTAPEPQFTSNMTLGTGTIFSNQTTGVVGEDDSTFNVSADWPSDQGKPVVYTAKWLYAPTVDNTVPVVVGFDHASQSSYTLGVVNTSVLGEVYGQQGMGANTSPAIPTQLSANTGSAPTVWDPTPANKLDGNLAFGTMLGTNGQWTEPPTMYSPYYRTANFIRAVGD